MGGPTSTRVTFENYRMDARTRDMLVAARVICKAPIEITQGSYNGGGVAASAGTHDGGGALDLRASTRTSAERKEIVACLRKVGFAAWLRTPSQGDWPYHVHAIAIGCPDLSAGAQRQVTAYKNGRNGLANNGPDDGPRTWVDWTWERYKSTYPDLLTEDELSAQDVQEIKAAIEASETDIKNWVEQRTQAYAAFDAKNTMQQLAKLLANIETVTQKYAVAVNEHTKQLDGPNDAAVAALRGELVAVQQDVRSLKDDVAAVKAAVDSIPKG